MKKILPGLFLFALLAACNTDNANDSKKEETNDNGSAVVATGIKDPVCEMDYDPAWVDYAVQGADTTWFCSSTCKDAFVGNPSKYSK